jgi:hypothetical protein
MEAKGELEVIVTEKELREWRTGVVDRHCSYQRGRPGEKARGTGTAVADSVLIWQSYGAGFWVHGRDEVGEERRGGNGVVIEHENCVSVGQPLTAHGYGRRLPMVCAVGDHVKLDVSRHSSWSIDRIGMG